MKPGSTLILTCAILSLWSPADAQVRLMPGQTLRVLPDDATRPDPRIEALEAQVATLTDRLERLESNSRASNFRFGAAASWVEANGADLLSRSLNHTHSFTDKTTWVNHYCDNADAGPDRVPCSQITGASVGTTSPPQ